jgi:DNA polymerase/3'-5' exonuclease PolX
MSKNDELIRIFNEIANLLDLQGEVRFKADAYRRAARSLESLGEDVERAAERGEVGSIPGVGAALEEKIGEFLSTGHIAYYEKLRAEFPPGVLEIMQLPGIGPKTTRRFMLELGVQSPESLAQAIDDGKLVGMAGFATRKIESLREALKTRATAGTAHEQRHPILVAWEISEGILAELRRKTSVQYLGVAGSLRRGRETVGDIDILATGTEAAEVFDVFTTLPGVREIRGHGDTKSTVIMDPGIQVDLRVVPPESFGAALQYFSGSKDHNIRLRTIARDKGLKINEYGVFRETERVAGTTEEEVYASLGIAWMPPEIRENRGEIEAGQQGRVPALVDTKDLKGELHVHVEKADDAPVREYVAAARTAGYRYLGLVLAGHGSAFDRAAERVRSDWASAGPEAPGLFVGWEGFAAEWAQRPSTADYLVLRPSPGAAGLPPSEPIDPTAQPLFAAHLPAPGGPERGRWILWASGHAPIGLDVSPSPTTDGLDSGEVQRAVAAGIPLFLTSAARRPAELNRMAIALRIARRGWAEPGHVGTTKEFRPASAGAKTPARPPGRSPRTPRK